MMGGQSEWTSRVRVVRLGGREIVTEGLRLREATRAAVAGPLTDDPLVTAGLFEMIDAYLGGEGASDGD